MTLAELTDHYARVRRRLYDQPERRKAWAEPEPVNPFAHDPATHTHWQRITLEVCAKHGVTFADMMGHRKPDNVVAARREAWWRIRNEVKVGGRKASYPDIGRWFGKNHTTVIHSVQRYACDSEA